MGNAALSQEYYTRMNVFLALYHLGIRERRGFPKRYFTKFPREGYCRAAPDPCVRQEKTSKGPTVRDHE